MEMNLGHSVDVCSNNTLNNYGIELVMDPAVEMSV